MIHGAELRDRGGLAGRRHDGRLTHLQTAGALLRSFRFFSAEISRKIGSRALADLITAHQLWCDWLESGRIRKFAVVAVATQRSRPDGNQISRSAS